MKIAIDEQISHFDNKNNQYNQNLISRPPNHVQKEIILLKGILKKNSPKKIADFGSGSGRFTLQLLKDKYHVIAIDISQKSLDNLYLLAKKLKLNTHLKIKKDINNIEKVDAIVGTDVLHHVEIKSYFKIFYSHLNKKGIILFSEPGAYNPGWYLFFTLLPAVKRISIINFWSVEKGLFQIRYFNLKSLLVKAGFKNINIIGYGLVPLPLFNWSNRLSKINIYLSNLPIIKLFAYRYIIYAEK